MIENAAKSPLASTVAEELRGFASKLKRKLREQGHAGDLTSSQASALIRLEKEGPMTTSALARAEGMRPQSMGTLLSALDAMGLVSGMPDPSDGRQTILSLTDRCRRLIQEGRAARQDWLSRTIEARLSPEEQGQVLAAIGLLQRLVEQD
ncbi:MULTISPECIES: MarR family transcriptional regulator [unclassified Rhizobium]|uniref:MarR family winged helix-turn-helix transcriptional regulator n=1 Tax=unclassified Rhizobium TaxID=2613769 RepID=UPI000BA8C40A|nr:MULTISPECIES: MarR family transcriptional regulator [unclassified Rhizobium]ASW09864.1 MarR family transcriptional regulator [Rhizobium sp. 11515TR]MDK4715977.1 MarR family transcriptional regulator [Rhizobium sp. CNPSo 4039]